MGETITIQVARFSLIMYYEYNIYNIWDLPDCELLPSS